jgi:peroxiredoxin (alkyl hydroperoxide reductase subunit C)
VALSANWPNNELIKDWLIISPAADEKTAAEKPKKYECFDWWFCHTKLKK